VPASMVDPLLRYRPIDAARGLATPLMVVTVEDDATTPTDHAEAIYEAAVGPKRLLVQRNSGHYTAYAKYADVVIPEIVRWLDTYVCPAGDVIVKDEQAVSAPFTNLGD
jgi:dipeptidyl aminopeptidase/acylaminoacyl peptidase